MNPETHQVDTGTFASMLRAFRYYERARDTYFTEFFDQDVITRTACERFIRDNRFQDPGTALRSVIYVLNRLFETRLLELQTVLSSVGRALFVYAVAEDYVRRHEEHIYDRWSDESQAHETYTDHRSLLPWVYRSLGLGPDESDPGVVERACKRPMLRYHPDVNPRGLQKAKEINQAYSIVIGAIAATG